MNLNRSVDEETLERFGYRQELKRTLGYFSSFAVSFSIISVTTGLFANYGHGLRTAGPAFIWTWLIVGAGQFLVALVFARLAEAIPLSGYAYQWTRQLAGPRLAWWAGWMMTIQYLAGMPGVCYALATYLVPYLGIEPLNRNVVLVTVSVVVAIALINQYGVRLTSLVNNVSVGAEILGTVLIGFLLLAVALWRRTNSFGFLFTHPHQSSGLGYLSVFAFSALMSAWTLNGFESAANLAEETRNPTRHVPRAIVSSEVLSVVVGFLVLAGFTLAISDLQAVASNNTPLLVIIGGHFPRVVMNATMVLVFVSIFACALANMTALTRMVWAMARDGQLPASAWLSQLSAHRVPANAIWTVALISSLFVLWAKMEVVIIGISALAGYLTYALVLGATIWNSRRPWSGERSAASTALTAPDPSAPGQGNPAALPGAGLPLRLPKALSLSALLWVLILLAMLSLPRSAWTNSVATLVAVGAGALAHWFVRHGRQRA
jgi:amino acid transporter